MKRPSRPSRPRRPSPMVVMPPGARAVISVPTHWSAEQAAAVFEIADLLQDQVWSLYGAKIQHLLQEDYGTAPDDLLIKIDDCDVPF